MRMPSYDEFMKGWHVFAWVLIAIIVGALLGLGKIACTPTPEHTHQISICDTLGVVLMFKGTWADVDRNYPISQNPNWTWILIERLEEQ